MAARKRDRTRPSLAPDGTIPVTYQGETAYYSERELRMLAELKPTPENENAARFIHAAKVHLDATFVGPYEEPVEQKAPAQAVPSFTPALVPRTA